MRTWQNFPRNFILFCFQASKRTPPKKRNIRTRYSGNISILVIGANNSNVGLTEEEAGRITSSSALSHLQEKQIASRFALRNLGSEAGDRHVCNNSTQVKALVVKTMVTAILRRRKTVRS